VLGIEHHAAWTTKRARGEVVGESRTDNTTVAMSFRDLPANGFKALLIHFRLQIGAKTNSDKKEVNSQKSGEPENLFHFVDIVNCFPKVIFCTAFGGNALDFNEREIRMEGVLSAVTKQEERQWHKKM
jgi:hypothetical protein